MRHKENGTVETVDEVQSGVGKTGREWRKRDVIVNIAAPGSQYANPVKITFWNDKEARAALLNAGDEVTVEFIIRGSEFNGRHKVRARRRCPTSRRGPTPTSSPGRPPPSPTPTTSRSDAASNNHTARRGNPRRAIPERTRK